MPKLQAVKIQLSELQSELLEKEVARHQLSEQLRTRLQIILHAAQGLGNRELARIYAPGDVTLIRKWRNRWAAQQARLDELEAELGGQRGMKKVLLKSMLAVLSDAPGRGVKSPFTNSHNEQAFLQHVQGTLAHIPAHHWVVLIMDQALTHKSASLVEWIAQQIGFQSDLGVKGKRGILKNKNTRTEFLESPHHRIRIVFTPKHCFPMNRDRLWLNQIENWFAILSRRVLKMLISILSKN